jgi:hypothetical protein
MLRDAVIPKARIAIHEEVAETRLARTIYTYTGYTRYFWQGNHQVYGHIRRIYTILANPKQTRRNMWVA